MHPPATKPGLRGYSRNSTGKLQKTCKILMARKSLIHIEFFDLLQSARLCATIYAAAYTINTEFTAKRAR